MHNHPSRPVMIHTLHKAWVVVCGICILSLMGIAVTNAQDDKEAGSPAPGVVVLQPDLGIYAGLSYQMELEAGAVISVAARGESNMLDAVLVIQGPDGEILAQNDNHDSEYALLDTYDALLEGVPIPGTGAYTIQVENAFWSVGIMDVVIIINDAASIPDVLLAVSVGAAIPTPQLTAAPLRTTGPCAARAGVIPANLRLRAEISSPVESLLQPDETIPLIGFIRGDQGFMWYNLEGGLWVREDAITLEGDCTLFQEKTDTDDSP